MTDVCVLVGTSKGLFVLNSEDRQSWDISGPFCGGWPINHAVGNPETGAIWAAGGNEFFGAGVWRGTGEDWQVTKLARGQMDDFMEANPEMAAFFGATPCKTAPFTGEIDAIWSLGRAGDTLYAGAKPAALYASNDGGASWDKVQGLSDHPSSDSWEPGGAGLTLHTIVSDPANPQKIWIGISAAGVFASEDGGATWDRRNRLSNAQSCDHSHPAAGTDGETGHCVHNIVRAPGNGDLLYQQNHHGVFRSTDGGRSWDDITEGLPSHFGFPVAVHPKDAQTLWTLPLNGDTQGRFPVGASAAVWRSRDGGQSWQAMRHGLPAKNCYFTVLRQAMATDQHDRAGVYFGTNSGSVFASTDDGESWQAIAEHLPTVLCVEVMQRA